MTDRALLAELERKLAAAPSGFLRVAFSGGMDSTVLLHALARIDAARARDLHALHVDHGLHGASALWADHCTAQAQRFGVPLHCLRVQVEGIDELGLEGAARSARHAALEAALGDGELLAMAHHRQDQAETVLLRLLHGAGAAGCAGMRALRRFGSAWLWRPLLDVDRATLQAYATSNALEWIEDPANHDARHARSALRARVLPALRERWPDADRRIAAAASRLREESDALEALAQEALALAQGLDPATLSIAALRASPAALQRIVIGRWLDALGLPRPPPGVWSRLDHDLIDARIDAAPCVAWRGAELRRYRELLYGMSPLPAPATGWSLHWDGSAPLVLPTGFGRLALDPPRRFDAPLAVRARVGGERLQQAGAHRELRTLLQDLGVPPWIRERAPLLFKPDGELLAAADLALAPSFVQRLRELDTCLRWSIDDDHL
jgi:tRNA(Ile)-lysidine synthase